MNDLTTPASTTQRTLAISEVVFRDDLYPRLVEKHSPSLIQKYAETIDRLPPIEVNQHNILIDGYHRLKAHQTVGATEIEVTVHETESEEALFLRSCALNSQFGAQMSNADKKAVCIRLFDRQPVEAICHNLSISERTFRRWTDSKRRDKEVQIKRQIFDMHLACYTQEEIADSVGVPRRTVTDEISEIGENGQLSESAIFGNFEPQLYTRWSFARATNETSHYGNIPPEIIDNLLYLYTKPFDVIFDPFGGGGSTIDVCKKRYRRYFVSDLNPVPAREHDIRQHDITTGLPKACPVPNLVFLDPPYWDQAKEKYSKDESDIANVDLATFLQTIGLIAKKSKLRWANAKGSGYLAIIVGERTHWSTDDECIGLALQCINTIGKYLKLIQIIDVPYTTQQHKAYDVERAKQERVLLSLSRTLAVFRYQS